MVEPLNGARAETLACAHLENSGLKLVARNYRCPQGEIDLIMHDGEVLVFVEVRYRNSSAFGSPAETVDRRKQEHLRTAASHYLMKHSIDRACRFDVVAVSGSEARIEWLQDAFS